MNAIVFLRFELGVSLFCDMTSQLLALWRAHSNCWRAHISHAPAAVIPARAVTVFDGLPDPFIHAVPVRW
jgi:hypothetical protein